MRSATNHRMHYWVKSWMDKMQPTRQKVSPVLFLQYFPGCYWLTLSPQHAILSAPEATRNGGTTTSLNLDIRLLLMQPSMLMLNVNRLDHISPVLACWSACTTAVVPNQIQGVCSYRFGTLLLVSVPFPKNIHPCYLLLRGHAPPGCYTERGQEVVY